MKYNVELISISNLKHIEDYSRERVQWLCEKITKDEQWTVPICISEEGYIMDGQHRFEVARKLNLQYIPAIIFKYEDIEIFSLREDQEVSYDLIRQKCEKNLFYPYKTVKHIFDESKLVCNYKLEVLYDKA